MYLHMQERSEKTETQKAQFFAAIVMQGVLDWCSVTPSSFWNLLCLFYKYCPQQTHLTSVLESYRTPNVRFKKTCWWITVWLSLILFFKQKEEELTHIFNVFSDWAHTSSALRKPCLSRVSLPQKFNWIKTYTYAKPALVSKREFTHILMHIKTGNVSTAFQHLGRTDVLAYPSWPEAGSVCPFIPALKPKSCVKGQRRRSLLCSASPAVHGWRSTLAII